jgi:hypothetical protein
MLIQNVDQKVIFDVLYAVQKGLQDDSAGIGIFLEST